jgi:glycosyltransferase involved in cell wall biosynthesis
LLYEGLAREGVTLVDSSPLRIRWLVESRRRVDVLHFHWPEIYYRHQGATTRSRLALSWLRLALFAVRLAAARLLGYRIVWTVHQVSPHESPSPRLDQAGTRVLARMAHLLVANDRATAVAAASRLRLKREPAVVAHGSYIGVYPPGRPRDEMRTELGIDPGALVFLSLGHLRRYKGLDLLLDAFAATAQSLPDSILIVAGLPVDGSGAAEVSAAAAADARIKPLLGFVADERVAELFAAADVAVLPRADGGTSGALVLALSHGVPVVAADLPVYSELVAAAGAGWLFEPGDPAALSTVLEQVAAEPAERRWQRAAAAQERAESLDWKDSCRAYATLLGELER